MTTAARPTFEPARGGSGRIESDLGAMSKQYSSRDLPGHTKLKYRKDGQQSSNDLKGRDFRKETEERRNKKKEHSSSKKAKTEPVPIAALDADDPINPVEEDSEEDEDEDESLLAELKQLRQERQAEQAAKEAERKEEEEKVRIENVMTGNPLLNQDRLPAEFKVKRRWNEDVVFKNCSRQNPAKPPTYNYINDTLRSEFHKKFMDKYIK